MQSSARSPFPAIAFTCAVGDGVTEEVQLTAVSDQATNVGQTRKIAVDSSEYGQDSCGDQVTPTLPASWDMPHDIRAASSNRTCRLPAPLRLSSSPIMYRHSTIPSDGPPSWPSVYGSREEEYTTASRQHGDLQGIRSTSASPELALSPSVMDDTEQRAASDELMSCGIPNLPFSPPIPLQVEWPQRVCQPVHPFVRHVVAHALFPSLPTAPACFALPPFTHSRSSCDNSNTESMPSPRSRPGHSSCHRCRRGKRLSVYNHLVTCGNNGCVLQFCVACVNKYFKQLKEKDVKEGGCPKCRGICKCSRCQSKEAKLAGSAARPVDVNDYMVV